MASYKKRKTKGGELRYDICLKVGNRRRQVTWTPPDDVSPKRLKQLLRERMTELEAEFYEQVRKEKEKEERTKERREGEPPRIPTVQEYVDAVFLPDKALTVAEKTRTFYADMCRLYIVPELGEYPLDQLTTLQLKAWLTTLRTRTPPLSHRTIVGVYDTLNQILGSAVDTVPLSLNALSKVQRPREQKEAKEQRATQGPDCYTLEEVQYVLQCLEQEPLQWQCFVYIMAETGIRRGEACALTWDAVDLDTGAVTISQGVCYTPSAGVYLTSPKSGKPRVVYVSEHTTELLRALKAEQLEVIEKRRARAKRYHRRLPQSKTTPPPWLFLKHGTGEVMRPSTPTRYFERIGAEYGLEHFHPHKLRHSFASIAITSGADVASVSELLGHADKALTLRMYTHSNEASKRKAAAVVASALCSVRRCVTDCSTHNAEHLDKTTKKGGPEMMVRPAKKRKEKEKPAF